MTRACCKALIADILRQIRHDAYNRRSLRPGAGFLPGSIQKVRLFLSISPVEAASLRQRRDELQSALHKIYHGAPHTDSKAYGKAQKALQNNEELTFSQEEIDEMLPESLRRGIRSGGSQK